MNGLWSYLLSWIGNLWRPGISRAQQAAALQGWASHSCRPLAQSMVATLLAFVPCGGVQERRPCFCSPACSHGRAGGVCTAVPSRTLWGALGGGGCAAVCLTGAAPAGSDGGQGRRRRRVSCTAARFPCCAAAPSAGRMGAGCWTRTQGWPPRPCRAAVCHKPNQISRSGEQFSSPWESVRYLCWPRTWLPASGMGPCGMRGRAVGPEGTAVTAGQVRDGDSAPSQEVLPGPPQCGHGDQAPGWASCPSLLPIPSLPHPFLSI